MIDKIKLREQFGGQGSGNFDHSGRPGEVGGSGDGGGGSIPISAFGLSVKEQGDVDNSGGISDKRYIAKDSYGTMQGVIKDLSNKTGIDEQDINAVLRAGAFQPLLSSYSGGHVIESVSRQFDIPISDFEKSRMALMSSDEKMLSKRQINNDYKANGFSFSDRPLSDKQMDVLTKTIYNSTQDKLNQLGVKSVTLYRGDAQVHGSNVIEHWTQSKQVAADFSHDGGNKGVVTTKKFLSTRVFSLPTTGFGVGSQMEVLVLGKRNGD